MFHDNKSKVPTLLSEVLQITSSSVSICLGSRQIDISDGRYVVTE